MRIGGKSEASIYQLLKERTQTSSSRTRQGDSIRLSLSGRGLAGKLVIRSGEIATKNMNSVNSLSDPSMRLMGKSLVEVKKILEEMKALTEKVKGSQLSRDERIDLQIEMVELQAALHEKTHNMGMNLVRPESADSFIDDNILMQRDRIIMLLERMRTEDTGTTPQNSNIIYDNPAGGGITQIIGYSWTDFELDENGFLKMRDEYFNALPDYIVADSLEDTFKQFLNGYYPKHTPSDEEALQNLSLSLLDSGSTAKSAEEIQRQLDALTAVEAEFNRLATVDPTVTCNWKDTLESGQGLFQTVLGMMRYRAKDADGIAINPLDVRLAEANDPIGKLFQKIDSILKDKVYASLGMGDLYKNAQKPYGISPEQLAIIEETKARFVKRPYAMYQEKEYVLPRLDFQSAPTSTLETLKDLKDTEQLV